MHRNACLSYYQRAHLAIGGITVTNERSETVLFSYPHYINSVTFTTAIPENIGYYSSLLGPFETKIWLFLFSLVSIAFLFDFCLNRELSKSSQIQWSVVSIVLGQPIPAFKSRLFSMRFLIFCWLLMSFTSKGDKIETIDDFIVALKTQKLKILTNGQDSLCLPKLKVNYNNLSFVYQIQLLTGPRAKGGRREEIS